MGREASGDGCARERDRVEVSEAGVCVCVEWKGTAI